MNNAPNSPAAAAASSTSLDLSTASPDQIIESAGLPEQLQTIVRTVTRKARLWKRERRDVARELCAHFQDGLEAHRTTDDLAREFGDPKQAARLIVRAKKRNRPRLWRAWALLVRSTAAFFLLLIAVYAILAVRHFTGTPTISRNYLAEFNAPIKAIPEADRAWPLYRAALMQIGPGTDDELAQFTESSTPKYWNARRPGDEKWDVVVTRLHQIAPALDLLRKGAARPNLGYVAGVTEDEELKNIRAGTKLPSPPPLPPALAENPPLINILLPHLGALRQGSRYLASDMVLAASEGDGARAEADAQAIVHIAEHVREYPCLISDLVSFALIALDTERIGELLEHQPQVLSAQQWTELAHTLAGYAGGSHPTLQVRGELAMFDDFIQRAYTDDGRGDGRLTPDGMRMMTSVGNISGDNQTAASQDPLESIVFPVGGAIMAGRAESRDAYLHMLQSYNDWSSQPPWLRTTSDPDTFFDHQEGGVSGFLRQLRYAPISILIPALGKAARECDRIALIRDSACTAIALELFHRREGHFPAALSELVPAFLPRVPIDYFDGQPLRYRLVDGEPVLYSIGVDRVDDGGVAPPPSKNYIPAHTWRTPASVKDLLSRPGRYGAELIPRGDWVLWPPSKQQILN